jgi:ADP-ribose pyrophosphatase
MSEKKVQQIRRDQRSKRNYEIADYDVLLPDGRIVTWSCVEGPDIAVVLAVDDSMNVLMKREWRLSQRKDVLELVSGKIDRGERPRQCAIRELKEEIGVMADKVIFLGKVSLWNHATVHAHIYLATGLHLGDNQPDQDEFLNVEKVPYPEVSAKLKSVGTNAQTLLAQDKLDKMLVKSRVANRSGARPATANGLDKQAGARSTRVSAS